MRSRKATGVLEREPAPTAHISGLKVPSIGIKTLIKLCSVKLFVSGTDFSIRSQRTMKSHVGAPYVGWSGANKFTKAVLRSFFFTISLTSKTVLTQNQSTEWR